MVTAKQLLEAIQQEKDNVYSSPWIFESWDENTKTLVCKEKYNPTTIHTGGPGLTKHMDQPTCVLSNITHLNSLLKIEGLPDELLNKAKQCLEIIQSKIVCIKVQKPKYLWLFLWENDSRQMVQKPAVDNIYCYLKHWEWRGIAKALGMEDKTVCFEFTEHDFDIPLLEVEYHPSRPKPQTPDGHLALIPIFNNCDAKVYWQANNGQSNNYRGIYDTSYIYHFEPNNNQQ